MLKKKKEENKNSFQEFMDKYKNDKKFNAKVQLIGYGIVFGIIVIYANIASMSSGVRYRNTTSSNGNINGNSVIKNDNKNISLLKSIGNNYEYDVKILSKNKDVNEKKEIHYSGKVYKNNMEILKKIDDNVVTYYKVDSRYYSKSNDSYELIRREDVYDVIEKEYIEFSDVLEYIELSSLDHVTDYSSGKKEYVYHLPIKKVIKSYESDDEIEIGVISEQDILTIKIDYSKLMNIVSENIEECLIEYVYQNIGKVEEFKVMDDTQEIEVGQ